MHSQKRERIVKILEVFFNSKDMKWRKINVWKRSWKNMFYNRFFYNSHHLTSRTPILLQASRKFSTFLLHFAVFSLGWNIIFWHMKWYLQNGWGLIKIAIYHYNLKWSYSTYNSWWWNMYAWDSPRSYMVRNMAQDDSIGKCRREIFRQRNSKTAFNMLKF